MKLNYTDSLPSSPSGNTPIILMHGMFGSLSNLGIAARAFNNANYRVISVDMRNHGLSPHEAEMSYELMANDIVELMDDLELPEALLLGHSMGGKVGMQVAMNHPERVAKLIVADIAPVTYKVDRHGGILDGLKALAETNISSRAQADAILKEVEDNPGTRAFLLKNLYRKKEGDYGLRLNLNAIIASYADTLTLAPSGNPFNGPTLFLKGSESAYIQEKHRTEILRLFPQVQLKIIDGTGHWLHAEKSEIFNRICLSFFNG